MPQDFPDGPIRNPGPRTVRPVLAVLAVLYLCLVPLNILLPAFAHRWVPGPLLYFSQIAGLFPEAKNNDVDYRAEGWTCADSLYREIDIRPFFPIQADNKENRFSRAMYFYRNSPFVLSRLAAYVRERHNAGIGPVGNGSAGRGNLERTGTSDVPGRIGGVRLVAVLTPIPPVGTGAVRYRRRPLADYDPGERRVWYAPSDRSIQRICAGDSP